VMWPHWPHAAGIIYFTAARNPRTLPLECQLHVLFLVSRQQRDCWGKVPARSALYWPPARRAPVLPPQEVVAPLPPSS
jgi:hypothetical protein